MRPANPLDVFTYCGPEPDLPALLSSRTILEIESQSLKVPAHLVSDMGEGWSGQPFVIALLRGYPSAVRAFYAVVLPTWTLQELLDGWPFAGLAKSAYRLYAISFFGSEEKFFEYISKRMTRHVSH